MNCDYSFCSMSFTVNIDFMSFAQHFILFKNRRKAARCTGTKRRRERRKKQDQNQASQHLVMVTLKDARQQKNYQFMSEQI